MIAHTQYSIFSTWLLCRYLNISTSLYDASFYLGSQDKYLMITSYSFVIRYVATYVCICDWICENQSKLHKQELKYILLPNIKATL